MKQHLNGAETENGRGNQEKRINERLNDKAKRDLYRLASERNIKGRSEMTKAQLLAALQRSDAWRPSA